MTRVRGNRRIERAGVNAVRTLLEDHNHIVQEIEGGNDHGEDLHVLLTRDGRRTGHVLAIQVKSGRKYKRTKGYSIPIGDHYTDWKNSRIPVVGVAYDLDMRKLYWVNLTAALKRTKGTVKRVDVPRTSLLSSETIPDFISAVESYIDSTGMRLREFTLEEALAAVSRALDGLDPNNVPNPLFEMWAELLARHEQQAKRVARFALQACPLFLLPSLLVYEWPYQVHYVKNYTNLSPAPTVGSLYIFISWMALATFFELHAGRHPKKTWKILIAVCGLYLWVPVMDHKRSGPEWMGEIVVVSSVLISNFASLTMPTLYVKREMSRRRRRST